MSEEIGIDGMTASEREIADNIYASMMKSMHDTDRSAQAKEFRLGVSDLGFCSERVRRFLARQEPEEIDMLPAFHGTWLGEGIEYAVSQAFPEAVIQSEVTLTMKGQHGVYEVVGHPDILFTTGLVLDVKSSNGLSVPTRTGMEDQGKRFQRHGYGWAAYENGRFDDGVTWQDVTVGNVWVDRSADERRLLVKTEPLSMEVRTEMEEWLDDVVYAWQNSEEARKEPPREVCRKACGFYATCRALDTDVTGLLTDPEVLTAVELGRQATRLTSEANKLRKEAKSTLTGVVGSTGEYLVRWTDVPPTKIDAHERAGYSKLEIVEVKK